MEQLYTAYIQIHGHALKPSDFGFTKLEELLKTMDSHFKVVFLIHLSLFYVYIYFELSLFILICRKKKSFTIMIKEFPIKHNDLYTDVIFIYFFPLLMLSYSTDERL